MLECQIVIMLTQIILKLLAYFSPFWNIIMKGVIKMDIILNDGESICKKCNGTGQHFISVSGAPYHNNHSPVYGTVNVCSKCKGFGKVDWITNAMGEGKNVNNLHTHSLPSHTHGSLAYSLPSEFTFNVGGKEMLKISDDGFYANGNKLTDDKNVYERFHKFLKASGY
jgi:hypothetical protein